MMIVFVNDFGVATDLVRTRRARCCMMSCLVSGLLAMARSIWVQRCMADLWCMQLPQWLSPEADFGALPTFRAMMHCGPVHSSLRARIVGSCGGGTL